MELVQHCAYNTSRQSFLARDVVAGEFTFAILEKWLTNFAPGPGAGLWLTPFRGIPSEGLPVQLDLIYLGQDFVVLDVVQSFPQRRVSPSSPPAASVLALPAHSVLSSQTQPGDQLLVCPSSEIEWRLHQLRNPTGEDAPVSIQPSADQLSAGQAQPAGLASTEPHPKPDSPLCDPPPSSTASLLAEPAAKTPAPARSWFKRLFHRESADNRNAARQPAPGMSAFFFTGGAPQAHAIRDISSTGLYVETAERWYPGTLVRMTLTTMDPESGRQHSISLHARTVRWGNDGVGVEFVLQTSRKARTGQDAPAEGIDPKYIEEFMQRLRRNFSDQVAS